VFLFGATFSQMVALLLRLILLCIALCHETFVSHNSQNNALSKRVVKFSVFDGKHGRIKATLSNYMKFLLFYLALLEVNNRRLSIKCAEFIFPHILFTSYIICIEHYLTVTLQTYILKMQPMWSKLSLWRPQKIILHPKF
jgi:hypothetical protein